MTDSAAMHAEAWKLLFDEVLTDPRLPEHSRGTPPFDSVCEYRDLVDGRSREDGVRAFLKSREIDLPTGTEDETADAWSVSGLAAKKNEIFLGILAKRGVQVFPGTEALLRRLREGGVPRGLVTASRNAQALLAPTGILELFDVVIDGTTAQEQHLAGKPDPAMFAAAAALLGVPPSQAVIVEDAVAGVQAGRRGHFGLVVGIARHHDRAALEAAGADLVVQDVSQLDLGVLRADPWVVTFEGFDPAHQGHREALTTLANGYLGTRGAAPEARADDVHYPGTYLSGVSNRLTTMVEGAAFDEEQLVNVPNWLPIDLRIENGDWWSTGGLRVDRERTDLELRRGLLVRSLRLTDPAGRAVNVTQRRLVSLARAHIAALETTIVPEGWAGTLALRSGIDASVTNANVTDLRHIPGRHLTDVVPRWTPGASLLVEAETTASRIRIATAIRTQVGGVDAPRARLVQPTVDHWDLEMQLRVTDGRPVVIEKTAAIVTSRDAAIASPAEGAVAELARAPAFEDLLSEHQGTWKTLWARFDVAVGGLNRQDELALRLQQFHLMQTLTRHTAQLDAGVPARGLHGEGYRGHVFWDELFVLPSLIIQVPEVARAALNYRWRRLPAARDAASALGLNGALFPWQSGTDGREETPRRLFNARSGRWIADNSHRQRHVGLAVAYNAWQYYVGTGDIVWLAERGGELIIDVARLFASMASQDPHEDRFHIEGVMGPDEYHDGYPHNPGGGIRDNAYTNVMAAWV
ncbi:MAG TPA: HAD-IA family hydrolase, partial [Propionicimonas sp.]